MNSTPHPTPTTDRTGAPMGVPTGAPSGVPPGAPTGVPIGVSTACPAGDAVGLAVGGVVGGVATQLPARSGLSVGVQAGVGDPVGARLREVAGLVAGRDRMMGRVAVLLVDLRHAEGIHDRLGGMTLQVWLEHVCRIPGADARALLGAIDVLERMPSMRVGLCDGWLSWLQVAAICRAARGVAVGRLGELDDLVASAMVDMASFEPDAIVDDVWQWVDAARPSRLERAERAADRAEFVSLSPRLFGGGSMCGEFGPVSFATIAEALDAALAPPPARDPHGLHPDEAEDLFATLDDQRLIHTRDHGARMAARLVDLCEHALAPVGSGGDVANRLAPGRARPMLLATIDVDALLDGSRTPGWLLHTLAGGRMKVSATTLQRLVDERGADLRGIVLDDCGQVVGVGHTTRVPPGWLRQAIWARDLTVRDPDGSCPIRRADLDHHVEWPDGTTDVTNLHPLGRRWHNHKTTRTWTVTRADDGSTTWRHRRHGWTLRLAPPHRNLTRPPRAGPPHTSPPDQPTPPQPTLTGVP